MTWRRSDIPYLAGVGLGLVGIAIYLLPLFVAMLGTDDFATIWVGPRAFLLGLDPYDVATWRDTAVRIGSEQNPSVTGVYLYPPWVTIALVPFALGPASAAGVVWTVIGMAAAVIAMRALLRACLPDADWAFGVIGFLLVLSAPAAVTFVSGQWTFFFVADLAAIALWLRAERPVAAGLATLLMLVKPPLFVFSALGLALRALWPAALDPSAGRRFVLTAIGAGALVIATAWLIIPTWWPAWFYHVAAVQVSITPVTALTLFVTLFGPLGAWLAAAFVLIGTVVALQFDRRGDAWLPVWFAFSSAALIYSNTYDLLLLIVPVVLTAGALQGRSRWRGACVIAAGAVALFPAMWYLHTFTDVRLYAASIPLALFVVIAAALWPERRTERPARAQSERRFSSR